MGSMQLWLTFQGRPAPLACCEGCCVYQSRAKQCEQAAQVDREVRAA